MSDDPNPDRAPETSLPTEAGGSDSPAASPAPEQIGPYRIVSSLGEGGMGTVYLAEQLEPVRREVALKVIRPGMDTEQVVARFDAERQALAIMTHPNVATVLDAGVTADGRPYFAMEYVAGSPITEYCDRRQLTVDDRLGLFIKVCQGLQHAHQKGIIHRDVKPSNVLVAEHDGAPAPSVIDFGIAKATEVDFSEDTGLTQHGMVLGTPMYMSPEQAGISGLDVDTTADVYSLGVLLYELLVGALPVAVDTLASATWNEKVRILWQDEAPRPSDRLAALGKTGEIAALRRHTDAGALRRRLRGDLDWVVMKAIEKDRARRYESAAELAADIQRHLSHEPVVASPPSAAYRARKFMRRHRVGVAASVAVLLALIGGFATSATLYVRSEQQRAIAEASVDFLTRDLLGAVSPYAQGRNVTMLEVLDTASAQIDGKFPGQPLVESAMRQTLGQTYRQLTVNDAAEQHLRIAVDLRRNELGELHPETLVAKHWLGVALRTASKYPEAEAVFEKVLEARRRQLGPDHLETLRTQLELGIVHASLGDDPGARRNYDEILAAAARTVGEDHRLVFATKRNLAHTKVRAGDTDGALALYREVLEGFARVSGPEHPDTLAAFDNLAIATNQLGDPATAVAMSRENLEVRNRVLGPAHLGTLDTRANLGIYLRRIGALEEARDLDEESLRLAREAHGSEHRHTLRAMHVLAISLKNLNDLERARGLEEEALAGRKRVLGPTHRETLETMNNLANTLSRSGDEEGSLTLRREVFATELETRGLEHENTTLANKRLFNALYALGRVDDAIVEGQPLCWLLEAEDASLTANQRSIRDDDPRVRAACGG